MAYLHNGRGKRRMACLACGEPEGLTIYSTSDYDEPECRYCGARHRAWVHAGCSVLTASVELLHVCAECEERYDPDDLPGLDEGLCPDCQKAGEDDGEATVTGPPVHPLNERETALVARAKDERLDLDGLCRDPWGELWLNGVPLWACLAPDDEPEPNDGDLERDGDGHWHRYNSGTGMWEPTRPKEDA